MWRSGVLISVDQPDGGNDTTAVGCRAGIEPARCAGRHQQRAGAGSADLSLTQVACPSFVIVKAWCQVLLIEADCQLFIATLIKLSKGNKGSARVSPSGCS